MTTTSGQIRTAVNPVRSAHAFEPVTVVTARRPGPLTECWDCGGTLTPRNGHGFVCATCSSLWRRRWIPCSRWERVVMRCLPRRYRWQRYRIDRA